MLLPPSTSAGVIEQFFQAELSDEMAKSIFHLPTDQVTELLERLHHSAMHWFQRSIRQGNLRGSPQQITSLESTSLDWLKSALLYLPGKLSIHDPFANAAMFHAFDEVNPWIRHELSEAVRDFQALRPLIADGQVELIPWANVSTVTSDLQSYMGFGRTWDYEVKIGVGNQIFIDTPDGDRRDLEDLAFWVPDGEASEILWWAVSSVLATVSRETRLKLLEIHPGEADWWRLLFSDEEAGNLYLNLPRKRYWLSAVLEQIPVLDSRSGVLDLEQDVLTTPGEDIDARIATLIDRFKVPSFLGATLRQVVTLRTDEEAFALFRAGFDDVYTRVLAEDNEDVDKYTRSLRRHATHTLGARQFDIERQIRRSTALSNLVDSTFTLGGAAATWKITGDFPVGAAAGLAAGQGSYTLNRAIERRKARRDQRATVSDFFGYLIRAD